VVSKSSGQSSKPSCKRHAQRWQHSASSATFPSHNLQVAASSRASRFIQLWIHVQREFMHSPGPSSSTVIAGKSIECISRVNLNYSGLYMKIQKLAAAWYCIKLPWMGLVSCVSMVQDQRSMSTIRTETLLTRCTHQGTPPSSHYLT
jgi:hypothetical protein